MTKHWVDAGSLAPLVEVTCVQGAPAPRHGWDVPGESGREVVPILGRGKRLRASESATLSPAKVTASKGQRGTQGEFQAGQGKTHYGDSLGLNISKSSVESGSRRMDPRRTTSGTSLCTGVHAESARPHNSETPGKKETHATQPSWSERKNRRLSPRGRPMSDGATLAGGNCCGNRDGDGTEAGVKTESNDEAEDGEEAEGTGGKDGLAMTPCAVSPLRDVTESARVSHDPAVNELPRRASEAEDFERGGGAASFDDEGWG